MAAVPPGFTSKFQAGRREKESRMGYRIKEAGQPSLSLFWWGNQDPPGNPTQGSSAYFSMARTVSYGHCCLVVTRGKGILDGH